MVVFSKTTSRSKRLGQDGDKWLEDQDGPDHIKLEPGTNPVMHGGRKNLTVDWKRQGDSKKTFGSVFFVVIIIRTRGADQGGNKSGSGSEIRKDRAKRFGVCNEHIKSVPILKTPIIEEEVMVLDANTADKSFNGRRETDQYNPLEELRKSKKRSLLYRIYNLSPNESRFP